MLSSLLRILGLVLGWVLLVIGLAWAGGALWFDFPVASLRHPVAIIFLLGALASFVLVRPRWRAKLGASAAMFLVGIWWFTLRPSNDRPWQSDVAETAWAEVKGDEVTLHNVRNCDYRTETDYTPRWETRTVRLSQITGIDLAITYWGSPWIAHPMASFQFADVPPVCFSAETRKEVGESYSAVGGLYRQYELTYIVAEESDVVRLRTNFREGEDVYLYRTLASPARARARFLEYLKTINDLHVRPRWYNAVTTNCTTAIRAQRPASERIPWDWRILANGKADEMLFERHAFATGGLSFAELKQRSRINDLARAPAGDQPFYLSIRRDLPHRPGD